MRTMTVETHMFWNELVLEEVGSPVTWLDVFDIIGVCTNFRNVNTCFTVEHTH